MGKLKHKIWLVKYTVKQDAPIAFGVIALPSMRVDDVSVRLVLSAKSSVHDVIKLVEDREINKSIEITLVELDGRAEVISESFNNN